MKNWNETSEKLNEHVELRELIEALLSEEEIESEEILKEKRHWWKFLEQVSSVPVEKLKGEASKIKEQVESETEREVKYCELLNIKPLTVQIVGSRLKKRLKGVKPIILADAYTIRWIYTFQRYNETKVPKDRIGNKINTLRGRVKKGRINKKEVKKLYKRACFIDEHVREGTPDKYSEELIEINLSKL